MFLANCLSLLAGIPTAVFNAMTVYRVLPTNDLTSYTAWYPWAFFAGTLVYYAVTVLVEGWFLLRWLKRGGHHVARYTVWWGAVIANAATYAVLGPVHFLAAHPVNNVREFTSDTRWARQPATRIVYLDPDSGALKTILSDGSGARTVVTNRTTHYCVDSNLTTVFFEDDRSVPHAFQTGASQTKLDVSEAAKRLHEQPRFESAGEKDEIWQDSSGDWQAQTEHGLVNNLRIYKKGTGNTSSVVVAANPGVLHIGGFWMSHPVFIAEGHECLFQCQEAIYLLDVDNRRVGKIADGLNFSVLVGVSTNLP